MNNSRHKVRADHTGTEGSIFRHNKELLRKTAEYCAICGRRIDKSIRYPDPMSFSCDHIIPISQGGKSTLDNLQATHLGCNSKKGAKQIVHENVKKGSNLPQYIDWKSYKEQ